MSRKGVVRPITISRKAAATVAEFITRYFVPAATESPSIEPGLRVAIASFAAKLKKAASRRGAARSSRVRLWTLTHLEAAAGARCAYLLYFEPTIQGETGAWWLDLRDATEELLIELMRVRGRGRPHLQLRDAESLRERHRKTESSQRVYLAGGAHVRNAKARISRVESVIEDIASTNPLGFGDAEAEIGREGLKGAVGFLLDGIKELKAAKLSELPE